MNQFKTKKKKPTTRFEFQRPRIYVYSINDYNLFIFLKNFNKYVVFFKFNSFLLNKYLFDSNLMRKIERIQLEIYQTNSIFNARFLSNKMVFCKVFKNFKSIKTRLYICIFIYFLNNKYFNFISDYLFFIKIAEI